MEFSIYYSSVIKNVSSPTSQKIRLLSFRNSENLRKIRPGTFIN